MIATDWYCGQPARHKPHCSDQSIHLGHIAPTDTQPPWAETGHPNPRNGFRNRFSFGLSRGCPVGSRLYASCSEKEVPKNWRLLRSVRIKCRAERDTSGQSPPNCPQKLAFRQSPATLTALPRLPRLPFEGVITALACKNLRTVLNIRALSADNET